MYTKQGPLFPVLWDKRHFGSPGQTPVPPTSLALLVMVQVVLGTRKRNAMEPCNAMWQALARGRTGEYWRGQVGSRNQVRLEVSRLEVSVVSQDAIQGYMPMLLRGLYMFPDLGSITGAEITLPVWEP